MKRQASTQVQSYRLSKSFLDGNAAIMACSESEKRSFDDCSISCLPTSDACSLNEDFDGAILKMDEDSKDFTDEARPNTTTILQREHINLAPSEKTKKKARKSQWSQLSLTSFFQKSSNPSNAAENSCTDRSLNQADAPNPNHHCSETPTLHDQSSSPNHYELNLSTATEDQDEVNAGSLEKEKNNVALLEWQRIQQLMQNSIPLCQGHKEPCIARIVKKTGPTFGRRFYVCARAEVFILTVFFHR